MFNDLQRISLTIPYQWLRHREQTQTDPFVTQGRCKGKHRQKSSTEYGVVFPPWINLNIISFGDASAMYSNLMQVSASDMMDVKRNGRRCYNYDLNRKQRTSSYRFREVVWLLGRENVDTRIDSLSGPRMKLNPGLFRFSTSSQTDLHSQFVFCAFHFSFYFIA